MEPTYHFLDLNPASQRYLFTKLCEFDIACNRFAKIAKKPICRIRLELIREAFLQLSQIEPMDLHLRWACQKDFNFHETPLETQKIAYLRLLAAENAKDWILTFVGTNLSKIEAIEAEAKDYAMSVPDEEIAIFFANRRRSPKLTLTQIMKEESIA
jgi:hypothetical protein